MNRDDGHLRLLSVFHYAVAALAGLFALLPVVHLVIGILMVTGRFDGQDPLRGPNFGEALLGWFFVGMAGLFMLGFLTFALCLALTGRALANRKRYTFCLVIAGIECAFTPFGTVLGVFTLVVLMRDSVRASFGQPAFVTRNEG
jgi:hypothetical protein